MSFRFDDTERKIMQFILLIKYLQIFFFFWGGGGLFDVQIQQHQQNVSQFNTNVQNNF